MNIRNCWLVRSTRHIAEQVYQIKLTTFSSNTLTDISSSVALNNWEFKCHQTISPVVCNGSVKYKKTGAQSFLAIQKTIHNGGGEPSGQQ